MKMNKIKEFMTSDWTLTEKVLLLADVLLAGVLIGFLLSPVRNGIGLFSNNLLGTNFSNNHDDDGVEEKDKNEEMEEDEV